MGLVELFSISNVLFMMYSSKTAAFK